MVNETNTEEVLGPIESAIVERDNLKQEVERLREAFVHADASDWDFLLSLLNKSVRHNEDAQTKFWIAALKKARAALRTGG